MRAAVVLLAALGGCTSVVRYTDELADPRTGRTAFVRLPATLGGVIGFVVGVPVDLVALPATYGFYLTQPKEERDPLSIFLFPSFVLWHAGTLIAVPFDVLEFACYRAWQPPDALSREERERRELQLDETELPDYPVETIYPKPHGSGSG